ncbi:penicillin acylase family protein [Duganella sp. HH101]|uniref:penicillin acylase family protein n=1 Tax=Duganella sp. HH101 TaxID=1781066 RepID=UPI0008741842|nr:penicillin acylase family protein [Duganella sp. HH101]
MMAAAGRALVLLALATAAHAETAPAAATGVEIRRTTDGIPHVRADNWRALGVGAGYVQAQDALCTLAEAFVTYEGRRAWFFGTDGRPARNATFGRPKNIDLDFFFRAQADDAVLAQYREHNPPAFRELVEGYADGYNRYLADARQGRLDAADRACLKQAWVRDIDANDVYRRLYAAQIAAGYARFVTEIAIAKPSTAVAAAAAVNDGALRHRLAQSIGDQPGLGSNMFAFGREATGGEAVLFGNPHWFWGGPDRFYQMHLTIPGQLDVAGATFLGIPLVMIGFNEHVAWSHTVSAARRFGLFDLKLDPADPTRYQLDEGSEAMTSREVSVDVRDSAGKAQRLTRTFYRTRYGPVLDLGAHNPAFGWGAAHAFAVRDVNADNFRIFPNYFQWSQARSLDEFIAIQRREAALPWVNTVAIGRGDGRVWYGDVGAVPNAPDALRKSCATPLAAGFAQVDDWTPVLDGSRRACDWQVDPAAAQPGAIAASSLPWLLREDYVANMNDSYWLSNARQPLTGYPKLLGGESEALMLRGRLGHHMALDLLQAKLPADALSQRLMHDVLTPRSYSAELFKDEVLDQACALPQVRLDAAAQKAAGLQKIVRPARKVDIAKACATLRRWGNKADGDDRGVLLWEALWARLDSIPEAQRYGTPFSADAPLDTPLHLRAGKSVAARALAASVAEFAARGWPLDAALGTQRYVNSGGRRLPVFGGCASAGYFAVACNEDEGSLMGPDSHANSYMQVVRFGASGVQAHTMLAHGLDEAAVAGGRGAAPVERYARKEWLRFPFREEEIARDPELTRIVLPAR